MRSTQIFAGESCLWGFSALKAAIELSLTFRGLLFQLFGERISKEVNLLNVTILLSLPQFLILVPLRTADWPHWTRKLSVQTHDAQSVEQIMKETADDEGDMGAKQWERAGWT